MIYHLEDVRPYADLTEEILGLIARGTVQALISTIVVAELLVKPFESGDSERIGSCERFLLSLPNVEFVAPDYAVAREAARIRAKHRLRTPDAIFLATASVREAALVTNDRALKRIRPAPCPVVILDDFV